MSPRPNLYTIPSEIPFLAALAEGIIARYVDAGDPAALARLTVLLPTRRAARSLATHLLDQLAATGGALALILPDIRPLGDVDEDALILAEDEPVFADADIPEPLPPLRRRLLLMQLVDRWGEARHRGGADPLSAAQSLHLAAELERLIDRAETQTAPLDQLARLAPAELSAHWAEILTFLNIVGTQWPHIESEAGAIGPARRRALLAEALRARWAANPPGPVIAAGSTGTIPSTAALLKTIALMPEGAVILPGLDQAQDEESWRAVGVSHAQGAMKALLETFGAAREDVAPWPYGKASASPIRTRLLNEALRPWSETGRWQSVAPGLRKALDDAQTPLSLYRIDAAHEGEEARVIALILREALETPNRRAALVTRERRLARAVQAELKRWDIEIDDSAGLPLSLTPPGIFLRLILAVAREGLAPVPLLALLKHPLSGLGFSTEGLSEAVLTLEREALRGPRPAPGFSGLYEALRARINPAERAAVTQLLDRLSAAIGPFTVLFEDQAKQSFGTLLAAHIGAAEALAGSEADLWHGEAGEAAATLLREVLAEELLLPNRPATDYAGFFEALLHGPVVRPAFGRHPRLFIWGPLEARLQETDVLVLGGLNEGSWPTEPAGDPWMSRGMAEAAGLPPPEQRLGLAAHDFVQGAGPAATVYLTRAQKRDGAPTIPSRWLTRLETLLAGMGVPDLMEPPQPWLAWARALDEPAAPVAPAQAPRPAPPRAARPRRLSVTEIETWVRDPYAIYARHVLGLRPLLPLDQQADAALRGRIVHQIAEILAIPNFDPFSAEALHALLAHGRSIFDANRIGVDLRAFWWPRFEESARWLLDDERKRRGAGETLLAVEREGSLKLEGPGGTFTLRARADRIDQARDGTLIIADYKTGLPPTKSQMKSGLAPQLPLEAMIAAEGGFTGIAPAQVSLLRVIRLMTNREGGETTEIADAFVLAAAVTGALRDLITRYDDPSYPYRARLIPKFLGLKARDGEGPYDHLARVKEWSVIEEEA